MAKVQKKVKQEKQEEIIDNDKIMGIDKTDKKYHLINKKTWKKCIYCEKYHPNEYFMEEIDYCIHCWAWLNSNDYDIEQGIYKGDIPFKSVKTMIKKIYPIHKESTCKIECIFDKIKKSIISNTLHSSLIELLELNKTTQIESKTDIKINKKKIINMDNVNYEKSYISI